MIKSGGIEKQFQDELISFRNKLGIKESGELEKKIQKDVVNLLNTNSLLLLKDRLQLGLLSKVSNNKNWHNATHTRLDHTIGVVAKCIVACDKINKNTNEDENLTKKDKKRILSEEDVRELVVAAAIHDCGHLPISHATERSLLTAKGFTSGVKHEERIVPLILNKNPLFESLQDLIKSWNCDKFFMHRVACIINPKMCDEFVRNIDGFKLPKRAIQQLLSSPIDMDRLDFVIRDSNSINYSPVTMISDKLGLFVNGLFLEKSKSLGEGNPDFNAEICLSKNYVENVFSFLVSRVLLYKYVYFSEKVRSFEAVLTNLMSVLLDEGIAIEPLKLIAMSDDYFISKHLEYLISFIEKEDLKQHLLEKHVKVLQKEKVGRFKLLLSIKEKRINNPRLREEFVTYIGKRSYIDNLRDYIFQSVPKKNNLMTLERSDILLDVFDLKAGGGDLLVRTDVKTEKNTLIPIYNTLKDFMNGSNMNRLCTETRLDVYIKSDLSEKKIELIEERIISFFKYDKNGD